MTAEREATIAELSAAFAPEDFGVSIDRGASALVRLVAVKEQIKHLTSEKEAIEQALRIELSNDPTPIVDGERGIVAVLKERKAPADFDLISRAAAPEAGLLIQAAAQGLLTVRTTQLRGMAGRSPAADAILGKYEMPSGVTVSLSVEETKR